MRREGDGGLGDAAAAAAGGGEGIRLVQMRDEAQHFHTVKKKECPPVAALEFGGCV